MEMRTSGKEFVQFLWRKLHKNCQHNERSWESDVWTQTGTWDWLFMLIIFRGKNSILLRGNPDNSQGMNRGAEGVFYLNKFCSVPLFQTLDNSFFNQWQHCYLKFSAFYCNIDASNWWLILKILSIYDLTIWTSHLQSQLSPQNKPKKLICCLEMCDAASDSCS